MDRLDREIRAMNALSRYIEATRERESEVRTQEEFDYEAERAADYAICAMRAAGFDWETDKDLVRYCLKATAEECALATRDAFDRYMNRCHQERVAKRGY